MSASQSYNLILSDYLMQDMYEYELLAQEMKKSKPFIHTNNETNTKKEIQCNQQPKDQLIQK